MPQAVQVAKPADASHAARAAASAGRAGGVTTFQGRCRIHEQLPAPSLRVSARAYQRGQRRVCRGAGGDFDDIVEAIRVADFEVAGGVETGEREQLSLFGCRV